MSRSLPALLVLATLSAAAASAQMVAPSQNAAFAEPDSTESTYAQTQAAPIQRAMPGTTRAQIQTSRPMNGVWLRSAPGSEVQTASADGNGTELRVERGVANVTVNHPEQNSQILVDLPGGQTALTKDGLYTFNAESNTVRVLHGEAEAFPAGESNHGIKIKEAQQLVFGSAHAKDVNREEANADLLPGAYANDGYRGSHGYGSGFYGGYGPYGDGFYGGSPYWAYDYPGWGWGYPGWGWGPGFGVGFYGGGFYGGGFRGGFGGFHGGGGFHGR